MEEAARRNNAFCVAVTEFISRKRQFQSIRDIVPRLKQHRNIRVIVLWIYGSYEETLRDKINIQNLTGKVWLLSEGQGTELSFLLDPGYLVFDGSIGLQPRNFSDAGFREYGKDLNLGLKKNGSQEWWSKYLPESNCSFDGIRNVNVDHGHVLCSLDLGDLIYSSHVPYILDAVYAVSNAIQIFIQETNCQQHTCNVKRGDVQKLFSRVNFNRLTGKITFDEHGDPPSTAIRIVNSQQGQNTVNFQGPKFGVKRLKQVQVGMWDADEQSKQRLSFQEKVLWNSATGTSFTPRSECVNQRAAGTRKSITSPCSWQCVPCSPGSVTPHNGLSEICSQCSRETYSNEWNTRCIDLSLVNVNYSDSGKAVFFAFAGGGMCTTLSTFAVFYRYWNSPIVKASNRELSLVHLIGISSFMVL